MAHNPHANILNTTLTSVPLDPNTFTYNTATVQPTISVSNPAPSHNIVFHGPEGKEVGRMDFNSGELVFEGNAHTSAEVFMEWCRKMWNGLRDKDKHEVLQDAVDALIEESSGELYSEEEKVAMLTCIQRVQEIRRRYDAIQSQPIDDLPSVIPSAVNALAQEGKV